MMDSADRKTILIIEDDPAVLVAYGRLLGRLNHRILLRSDCADAWDDPRSLLRCDLLILDQQMPGGCGLDLLAEMRKRGPLSVGGATGPVVLLISASVDDQIRARAERLGVAGVIEKPVDPAQLLDGVKSILETERPMPLATRAAGDRP